MQPDDIDFNPVGRQPLGDFDPWARTVYLPGVQKQCANCGTMYRATPNNAGKQRACSNSCRTGLWLKRKTGQITEPPQPVAVPMWKYRRNYKHPPEEQECSSPHTTASAS